MITSRDKKGLRPESAPTLRSTIWLYFSVFTAVILILIWFFQVVTLDKYYELSKRRKIISSCLKISVAFDPESMDSVEELVENIAYQNGMTIAITDWSGNTITKADYMGGKSILSDERSNLLLFEYRNELIKSADSHIKGLTKPALRHYRAFVRKRVKLAENQRKSKSGVSYIHKRLARTGGFDG